MRNEVGKITGAPQLELISPAGNPFSRQLLARGKVGRITSIECILI